MFLRIKLVLLLYVGVILGLSLNGQTLTVEPNAVTTTTDDIFTISYKVNGGGIRNFQAPSLTDFQIVSGPNRSQSMQFINGSMSQSASYSYQLQAKQAGTFFVPRATVITDNGQTLKSPKIRVIVEKGRQTPNKPSTQQPNNQFFGKAKPNQGGQKVAPSGKQPNAPATNSQYHVWVDLISDTTSVYQGQQVTAIYRLYTNVDITNYSITAPPSFTGYWVQDITPDHQQTPGTVTIDSIIYRTLDLKKYALFPQRSGELLIDPMDVEVIASIPTGGRDVWGRQRKRSQKLEIKSDTLLMKVFSLPDNKPVSFSGAVGKFKLDSYLSNPSVKANESLTYTINISGTGNIKLLGAPQLNFPTQFETFEPVVSEDVYPKRDVINGSKKFEYTVIANEAGSYQLPVIAYSYFDPELKQYKTLEVPARKIQVAPGDGSIVPKEKDTQTDIRALKSNVSLFTKQYFVFGSLGFIALMALPFIILPIFIRRHQTQQTEQLDTVSLKRKAANGIAMQRLSVAKKHLNASNKRDFYDEVIRAIWGYLCDKFNMPMGDLSKDNISQVLNENGLTEQYKTKLIDTISYCEMALFAPAADANKLQDTYDSTLSLLADLEENLAETA